jgi:lipopolysaccharide/colanic/teichoic acid biosynthesis glycosyltransferase
MCEKGRRFVIYKFRSMTSDADQRKAELKKLNIMKGPAFKVVDDPRITRVGKWLRRLSLDETPQLWNVLRGEMSLVGPRPTPVAESVRYKGWQRKRFSMKPGLTCLWQVRGRNEITDLDEWMNLDLAYVNSWSLWLDFKILLETIPIVLTGKGAA